MFAGWGGEDDDTEPMDTSDYPWYWVYQTKSGMWQRFEDDPVNPISSSELEMLYVKNPCGVININTAAGILKIDFCGYWMTNLRTGQMQKLKRSLFPEHVIRCKCADQAPSVPAHWENTDSKTPYECVQHVQQMCLKNNYEEFYEEEMDTSEPNWHWFYLAECGVWHIFEIDPSAGCSVTSEQIEANYNRNQHGSMDFYTPKYSYRLDFSVMKQINVTTGKQRPIKRARHSATGFRFICDNLAIPVPSNWERVNTDEPYQLIPLCRDTFEYKDVARLYERTMSRPIKSIQRIQNLDLWEFFCRKKAQLRKIKRTVDIDERMLFHGTGHSNIQAICTFNFDWRLTGSHGNVYGKGSYFARDAKYSSKFCLSTSNHNFTLQRHGLAPPIFQSDPPYKCMFLARVLVGEYTVGHPHFCRPPSNDRSITNLFDSCVDDMKHPKIFVIFDSSQIYPEYLIEFY